VRGAPCGGNIAIGCSRTPSPPASIGAYIAAAYWFTASTSFANPAVTLARGFTATFAGIGLGNVPAFVLAQLIGAALALFADRKLRPTKAVH
jgi:glycerol uptake facilitator-like aquaporin